MQTLQLNSRGEEVRTLQRALGVNPDGVFGPTTRTILINYQRTHHLTPDGVCGSATWASLGINTQQPSPNTQHPSPHTPAAPVTHTPAAPATHTPAAPATHTPAAPATHSPAPITHRKPLSFCLTSLPNRTIKYIVIHFTAGSHSRQGKALQNYDIWRASGKASADFAVDDHDIVQFNPDPRNKYSWAVAGKSYGNKGGSLYGIATNRNTVSIEICSTCNPSTSKAVNTSNHHGWFFTPAALDNARRLTRYLMALYNIDRAHVVRHYDITGKLCPGIPGWNNEPIYDTQGNRTNDRSTSDQWQAFVNSL